MADTRAARASRRAFGRATTEPAAGNPRGRPRATHAADRATDEPRVEHPDEDDNYVDADEERDPRDGFCEDAESSHPSQSASSQGRPAPTPGTALLMAEELLHYRPLADAQDNWQGRLQHLIGIAAATRTASAPSRSLANHHSGRAGTTAHGAPPPPPPPPQGPPPARAQKAPSHVSSPRDCLIVQRTTPDARVEMDR